MFDFYAKKRFRVRSIAIQTTHFLKSTLFEPKIEMLQHIKSLFPNSTLSLLYRNWDFVRGNPNFTPELNAIAYLGNHLKNSLDIGSHNGAFIRPLLRFSRSVIAFEPIPDKFSFLQKRYSSDRVSISNIAISDIDGKAEFRVPYSDETVLTGYSTLEKSNTLNGLAVNTFDVTTAKLDSLQLSNIGLIKIDVEGHEYAVLEGGRQLIQHEQPNIIIETENRHNLGAPEKVIAFFKQYKYDGYMILGRKVISASLYDKDIHQNISSVDFTKKLTKQDYAYNFLFVSPKYKQKIQLPAEL